MVFSFWENEVNSNPVFQNAAGACGPEITLSEFAGVPEMLKG
jgi:hypothetical protein